MAVEASHPTAVDARVRLEGRLGIDQPVGWWPATPRLKSYEAAGFSYVQVMLPPPTMLEDDELVRAHAGALRDSLGLTGLRVIGHAPGELLAGSREHDRQLRGALAYAALAGAELLVYHGARVALADGGVGERLRDEQRSLRRLLPEAAALWVRIAIENLAPDYPGPEYVCHNPGAQRAGSIEPVRLDLHLPPGAGSIQWRALAPLLARNSAPLQLEIHPAQRPKPATLAVLVRELLGVRGTGTTRPAQTL